MTGCEHSVSTASTVDCSACGDCCRKGGPVLHSEDLPLLPNLLPLNALLTLRAGELAFDPVTNELSPLTTEVIKVKGSKDAAAPWQCVFLEGAAHCRIYDSRPSQCRALFCRDTAALETLYQEGRLTRADILATAPQGWLALAQGHEDACDLMTLAPLAHSALEDSDAQARLLEALRFDAAYRDLCVSKAQVPPDHLDCLLGRPLSVFLESFGLGLVSPAHGEKVRLERVSVRVYP